MAKKGLNAKRRVYGAQRSAPGAPPYKQTGLLRASVTHELSEGYLAVTARVGTNLPYGKYLELGTRKMAARPWLRRALLESMPELRRVLGG
jgi:HK97 gp10 family phage protein